MPSSQFTVGLKIALVALFAAACSPNWPVSSSSCDYEQIAKAAISERFPWFEPKTDLAMVQYQDVMIGFYPLPKVMPGGTAHAIIGVRACNVRNVYLTQ